MSAQHSLRSILVVCLGNLCRSPMAEGLLREALGPGWTVGSAGLRVQEGHAPHPEAIRLMAERGINLTPYRSRQVTPAMALSADLVLVMEHSHKMACEALAPSARGRIFLLGHWLPPESQEVADPMGGPPEGFAQALDLMVRAVGSWRTRLVSK